MRPPRGRRTAPPCLAALASLMLAACGTTVEPTGPQVFDNGGDAAQRAALSAFARGRYQQAANGFRRALTFAHQRDDSRAVVDARYNLAASLAQLGEYDEALQMLNAAQAELRREGLPVTTDIALLRAAVSYRAGQPEDAELLAQQVRAAPDVDPALVARAWFLSGLIAADAGDRAGLARAIAALPPAGTDVRLAADRAELTGRLEALDGQADAAVESLGAAARERSERGDYRAASRALAAAGKIAMGAGLNREAARHYLRAGRSAAALDGETPARTWLEQARSLSLEAHDPQSAAEADAALAALDERAGTPATRADP